MSKKTLSGLYDTASPLGYLEAQQRELAAVSAEKSPPPEIPALKKQELLQPTARPDTENFRFQSPELNEDDYYDFNLTEGGALDDMGDLLFDLLRDKYGEAVFNVKLELHQHTGTGRYVISLSVDPDIAGAEEMSDEKIETARQEAAEVLDDIMMVMDEGNSGDETYESLSGFEIDHNRRKISVPSMISMLEMIRNFARESGIRFYNIHSFTYSVPQDVEKTPGHSFRDMIRDKAELLVESQAAPGFFESVADCTLMKVFNSRTDYLAHAQMVLESVGPEDLVFSTRIAIIESKIYMEDAKTMGDWYRNADPGAIRPSLN